MANQRSSLTQRIVIGILYLLAVPLAGAVDVLTFHNDNMHSGTNAAETVLNQGNVNYTQFGVVGTIPVNGDVFAQPLYVSGVNISGSIVNVLIVATENNYVYAFNADTYQQIWSTSQLATPALRSVVIPSDTNYDVNIGITSTPAIDKANGFVYVCGLNTTGSGALVYNHTLWKLNLATGAIASQVNIAYANGPTVFVPIKEGQRPALTLDQTGGRNNLYIAFASFSDSMTYCGFVFSYNATSLAQQAVFAVCPAAYTTTGQDGGGIWMSGCGPAIDSNGDLLLVTGNGYSDANGVPTASNNFGESIVRLDPTTLAVKDYYTPSYRASLNSADADLGVGGLTLLPPQSGSVTNLVVHDSKEGKLYVENRDNLGQFNAASDAVVQATNWFGGSLVKATPVYWTDYNGILHVIGAAESNNPIKSFTVSATGTLTQTITSKNLDTTTNVSLTQMALSCNGTAAASGILWTMSPTVSDPIHLFGPGIMRAYNADTLVELYNSTQNASRDAMGYWPKNCAPLVANGKVYVASLSNLVYVYGLVLVTPGLSATITSPLNNSTTSLEPATITINVAASSTSTTVTKVDFYSGNTQIGEVTSQPYTINWTPVYGGTYILTAIATDSVGASAVSTAVVVTVPGFGTGSIELQTYTTNNPNSITGLLADANYPSTPDSTTYPTTASGPVNSGMNNYGNRLIGYVYPPITGKYYFWIASDDASNLYLSTDSTPAKQARIAYVAGYTAWQQWNNNSNQQSALIPLVGGQRYFIQAIHVQGTGGDNLDVGWQLPDGAGGAPGTFERPIQGAHLSPPVLAPLVSPRSASYSGAITISMTTAIPAIAGQAIYYTTNGTPPTTGSTLYTGPFVFNTIGTTTVKAISVLVDTSTPACPVGTVISPVSTTTYTLTGPLTAYGVASLPPTSGITMPPFLTTGPPAVNPPPHLSGTGVFTTWNVAGLVPAAGVLPYNVIAPLWSDGATKNRWIALPPGGKITFAATGEFIFPAGTVMIKNFVLGATPLELRMLVLNGPNAGYGVTYQWNSLGTDADLMGPGSPSGLSDGADQTVGSQTWHFPSRAECLLCHTGAANFVLGPKTRQLNTTFAYPGGATDNELRTWNYLQMFSTDIGESNIPGFTKLTNISDTSGGATVQALQDRVRSYVDANCGQCHRPGGVDTNWDARFDTPLANQGIVNGAVKTPLGIIGAEVVYPDLTSASMMHLRMNSVDPTTKMPPLARNLVDTNALGVVDSWINLLPPNQPSISAIAPTSGPVGNTVTISGSNFAGTSAVTINSISAAFVVASTGGSLADNSLTITVPIGASTGTFIVTACGLTATSGTFTVIPTPVIGSFTPGSGPVGTVVTITGSGLTGASAVGFNGALASAFTVNSDTAISATIANATATGGATISVATPGGTALSGSQFTVIATPIISSFTPGSGPAGTVVTITGSGLTGATAVSFNGTSASTFTVNSDTAITATIANATATGGATISVTTPGGTALSGSQFTVLPSPIISSFTPGSGPVGTVVTIFGTGLTGAIAVTFHGTPASTFTVNNDTSISATIANATVTGVATINVTTPSGSALSPTQFYVTPPPNIVSFTPGSGPVGTVVTITGSGLTGATAVSFHGTAVSTYTVNSDTSISATIANVTATGGATISVTTPGGTALSGSQFTVIAPPNISSFSPGSGPVGTVVTITGTGLTGATAVSFHGTAASTYTVNSDTAISATIANVTTTGGVTISVTTPGGTALSGSQFTVIPPPIVSSFTPGSGPVGTAVTITGSSLTGATAVSFHGTPASTYTVNSDTSISATIANVTATGGATISVTTPGGTALSGSQFTVIPPPNISSFSPGSGPVGTVVTITGTGLTGATAVSFHGTAVSTYTVNSDISISATIANATATGGATISVTTPGGTALSGSQFTVIAPPNISSFSPGSGPVGTMVTITGTGLTGATAVSFHGTAVSTYTVNSDISISATIANATVTGGATISATTPGGTALSGSQFTVIATPIISSFTPGSGPVGTVVTITGSGLTGATAVSFHGTAVSTYTVNSDTSISATIANITATGGATISVTTPGGTALSGSQFTVIPPPNISSFSPGSGPVGTVVTITGTGLTGATAVSFHGTAASTYTVNSDTAISATIANVTTTGGVTISVTTPGGTALSGSQFTVIPPPIVSSFTPGSGPVGTAVTITGSSLTGATAVSFHGTPASTYTVNSDTSISATIANVTATGGATISVTTPGGTALSGSQFTVIPPPNISSFSPGSGPVGTVVTITGTGLTGATAVSFHGTAVSTYTVNSDISISATIANATATGGATISVTTPGGTALSGSQFTVIATPIISSFTPGSGPVGTAVTITGSSLTGATAVSFHGTPASTYTVNSDTSISATIANVTATGGATISVTTPGGTALSGSQFTVIPPPNISSFSPGSGPVGTVVTITGTGLTGATAVSFHGTAASTYTVNSDTAISATIANVTTTGGVTISVTTPGGTALSGSQFTVIPPPIVSSFTPGSGPVGTAVTITGSSLTGATAVSFHGTPASTYTVNSDTSISATIANVTATGGATISVTTPGGTALSGSQFTVIPPPNISSFSPGSGPVGTVVTITGTGLTGATAVSFHGTAVSTYTVNSDISISATIANATATGGATISVTTPGGTALSGSQFTVIATPIISSFTPGSGPVGTVVTITGSGLTGATAVSFHGTAVSTYTVNSDTSISATIANVTATGGATISVTTPGGVALSGSQFTVIPPPIIASFTPGTGPVASVVTISGSGLTGATAVTFGGVVAASFTINSDTSISATIASNTPLGAATISVTTPGGSGSSGTQYMVIAGPAISSIAPASGPVGTVVTITGGGLTGATAVSFGATAASAFTVNSDTSIIATVANSTPLGAETISVTTPGGTALSSSAFTVYPLPNLVSFTPGSGPVGTVVTITGSGLTGATAVSFHGTAVSTYTVNSDTSISATIANITATGGATISVTTPGGTALSGSQFTVIPPPNISSFSPGSGPVGTVVTITGTGLTGATAVSFHGTAVSTYTVNSDISISATIANATATGGATISVTTPGGTALSGSQFTVIPPPIVSSFTPGSGPIGTAVTITGTGLTGATAVSFHGTPASTYTVNSDTSISATIANVTATGGATISVTTPGGTALSGSQFTVIAPPNISSFTPGSGPVGTVVTITGTGLTGATAVSFHGTAASTYTVNSDTAISATIANVTATGGATISVTTPGGTALSGSQFTVIPPPIINAFSPGIGPVASVVTITGSGLAGATAVSFGGIAAASFTVNSDIAISATIANSTPPGAATISVTTPGGSATSGSPFTIVIGPAISSYSPVSGPVGTLVTINGGGLTGATAVSFGATAAATYLVVSDTAITATVANSTALGAATISVTTPGGTAVSSSAFTVLATPILSSFTPGSGPVGTVVTISGTGLTGATAVTFNGTAASAFTVISDTSISATIANATTTGGATISVTTPGGTALSGSQFTVIAPPIISSFTPGSGPVGTAVTISGTGLSGATAVSFHGTPASTFTVNSETSITATIANATVVGAATISVSTPGGTGLSSAAFIVFPPPSITSFTPLSGPVGTVVTITGTGLTGTTSVSFHGTSAITYTVNSDTQITATVPAAATTGVVSVTAPGGSANGSSFTVIPPPLITGLTPNQGSIGIGVAISGSGLTGTTAVNFNGTSTTFSVISDTLLTTTVPVGATTGSIVVTTPGGIATSGVFSVVAAPAPTITSISPAAGAPGSLVTITGTGLGGVSAVSFNGTYAIFTVNGAGTQIIATIPTGANSGPISVYSPQGDATSPVAFTNTTPINSPTSSSSSSGSHCGKGVGVLIGLMMLMAMLRRLRLRDQP